MSGKTSFVLKLLSKREQMFDTAHQRILYVYDEWQPLYESLKGMIPGVEFTRNLDGIMHDDSAFDAGQSTLLVLDDVANAISDNLLASKLFTQKVHHRNVSVIMLLNNFYKQGKAMRDIHLNVSYIFLFRNIRDTEQIKLLARQTGLQHLNDAYKLVTKEAFQPLMIDLKSDTPDYLRIRSHIFPDEKPRVYCDSSLILPSYHE